MRQLVPCDVMWCWWCVTCNVLLVTSYDLRGHCYKLATQRSRLEVRWNYFSQRVVGPIGIDSRVTSSKHLLWIHSRTDSTGWRMGHHKASRSFSSPSSYKYKYKWFVRQLVSCDVMWMMCELLWLMTWCWWLVTWCWWLVTCSLWLVIRETTGILWCNVDDVWVDCWVVTCNLWHRSVWCAAAGIMWMSQ